MIEKGEDGWWWMKGVKSEKPLMFSIKDIKSSGEGINICSYY